MPPETVSGGISRDKLKRGSPNFARLSATIDPTNRLYMKTLIASGRLQNAIEYCTKVTRKTGPAGQGVKQEKPTQIVGLGAADVLANV